ncbi:DNA-directed RNA polymerase subunit delta [Candidatus Phytoplasma prunorum]|uniref:DNA-directed RNA polymerase subunit delta n=1 Tax=Candidatus Phytoplasma prunorum TaxID=47565 RepID=UPI002FF12CE9
MKFLKQKNNLELAEEILKKNKFPMNINDLINKICEINKIVQNNYEKISQLYLDINLSSKFIFCGEELWALKENNVKLWDKDCFFNDKKDIIEEDNIDNKDYIYNNDNDYISEIISEDEETKETFENDILEDDLEITEIEDDKQKEKIISEEEQEEYDKELWDI